MKSIEELENMNPEELGDLLVHVIEHEMELEYIRKIIESGAVLNHESNWGLKPLHFATMYGYNDLIKLLVNYGADINDVDNSEMTALHHACNPEDFNQYIRDSLLPSDEELDDSVYDYGDVDEYYPGIDTIELLIALGADINALDDYDQTPLHLAVLGRYVNISKLLSASGADLEAKNDKGKTAWDLANQYIKSSCPKLNPNYNG